MTLLADFLGSTCSSCGGGKIPKQSFCGPCYRRLPTPMQRALYKRFDAGYEGAFGDALNWLKANRDKR
jgi:hypothetical protein